MSALTPVLASMALACGSAADIPTLQKQHPVNRPAPALLEQEAGVSPDDGVATGVDASAPAPATPTTVPVYRAYNAQLGDHLYGVDKDEGLPGGWVNEWIAFRVLTTPQVGTRPLYRCRIPDSYLHLLSTEESCEGTISEGLLGYVYTTQAPNTFPIHRCWSGNTDHITTHPSECAAASYIVEFPQGFAVNP